MSLKSDESQLQGPSSEHTARWIESHISQPAQGDEVVFSKQMNAFTSSDEVEKWEEEEKQIWADALNEATILQMALEKLQKHLKKKYPDIKMINAETASWRDVMAAIQDGASKYENELISGPKGFLRKTFRALGKNAVVFKEWLKFVPQGNNYLSPLCASFHIILTVAKKIRDVREELLKALKSIPEDFDFVHAYLDIYQEHGLKKSAAALYTSIIQTLQQVVVWCDENPFKKVGRAVLKLDRESEVVDDLLQNMSGCKARFKEHAECALHKNVAGIKEDMARRMDELLRVQKESGKESEIRSKAQNALLMTLLGLSQRTLDESRRASLVQIEPSAKPLDRNEMLNVARALGFDNTQIRQENLDCFRNTVNFDTRSNDCLDWIKQSSTFQNWSVSQDLNVLLIESDDQTTLPMTHLSFLCASIAHLLSRAEGAIALTYFCGLRCRGSNSSAGAKEMMISFIGQMMSQWPEHWNSPRVDAVVLEDVEKAKLSALHQAFRTMVSSLPKEALLYILIDGVENLELPAFRKSAEKTLHQLVQLCINADPDNGAIIKLLMTAPNRTTTVARALSPEHVLYVPEAGE